MSQIQVGRTVEETITFSQADFDRFAALSGDDNPIHVDPDFAARTRFGRTVAHGMFLYSQVCALLGREWPGARFLEQQMVFRNPTFAAEPVTIRATVAHTTAQGRFSVLIDILRADGEAGLEGEALLLPSGRERFVGEDDTRPTIPTTPATAFKGLALGQEATMIHSFGDADLAEYKDLVGDQNPLYSSNTYARKLGYEAALVPPPLLGGLFSCLLGTELPGRGTNWLKQSFLFLKPAYCGQPLTASVRVVRLRPEKQLVNLQTTCTDHRGFLVCDGEALVLVKDLETNE